MLHEAALLSTEEGIFADALVILVPLLLACLVVWLIRWTERRDAQAAQEEVRVLMQLSQAKKPPQRLITASGVMPQHITTG